ncbi:hypothetical protein HanRHA438_Chr04g0157391 [Helianthus annuus]|nr:hypothetical protein HanRHA438_Chr04g0157391 [Helianthus annuus]
MVLWYSYQLYLFGTRIVLLLVPTLHYFVPMQYWYSYWFCLFGTRTSARKIRKKNKVVPKRVPYQNIGTGASTIP